jgi:aldose sugar dehydrogenase
MTFKTHCRTLTVLLAALAFVLSACGETQDSGEDEAEPTPTPTTEPRETPTPEPTQEPTPEPTPTEAPETPTPTPDPAEEATDEAEGDDPGWVDYDFEVMATGLDIPWELVFLPDGDVLITERPGTVRVMQDGELLEEPVLEFDDVVHERGAEGGLLGMTLHPEFEENGWIYFYYTYEEDDEWRNCVVRFVLEDLEFSDREIIIDDLPGAFTHNGGRMKFGPDDQLYVTLGDAQRQDEVQDVDVLVGKILRLNDDGTYPDDNPFEDSPVYAIGLRNPQGLAWHPETGELYSSQHGPTGNDELNLIEAGENYGWPDMEGFDGDEQDDFTLPVKASGEETWAPSGSTFYDGDLFPQWNNEYLMAGLRSVTLHRINLSGDEPEMGPIVQGEFGRLRTVVQGPDGLLYLLTSNRDERAEPDDADDRLIRIIPAE